MAYTFTEQQLTYIHDTVRKDHDVASLQNALDMIGKLSIEKPPSATALLADPPGFNGETCALCKANVRIQECGKCGGSFDNIGIGLRQQREVQEHQLQVEGEKIRAAAAVQRVIDEKAEKAADAERIRVSNKLAKEQK